MASSPRRCAAAELHATLPDLFAYDVQLDMMSAPTNFKQVLEAQGVRRVFRTNNGWACEANDADLKQTFLAHKLPTWVTGVERLPVHPHTLDALRCGKYFVNALTDRAEAALRAWAQAHGLEIMPVPLEKPTTFYECSNQFTGIVAPHKAQLAPLRAHLAANPFLCLVSMCDRCGECNCSGCTAGTACVCMHCRPHILTSAARSPPTPPSPE